MSDERIIFHIDVNNAFLSWTAVKLLEEGYGSDIRLVPSVIGGDESKRHGVVLAKSPVAKKMGIKTAETLYSARKKCKNLLVFPSDFKYYSSKSKQLFDYLKQYTPNIEIFSIDECFLDLTNTKFLYSDLLNLAYKIKDEVNSNFGFTVNIGIGNNKLCAKMASDFEKPNKVHTLYKEEFKRKLWNKSVGELFMIGNKSAEKLNCIGINTIEELANADLELLKKHFKSQGIMMKQYANGEDDSEVINYNDVNKCISVSETFEVDVSDIERLENTLFMQVKSVAKSLRKQKSFTTTVAVMIKTYEFKTYSKQRKLNNPTDSTNDIYNIALEVFNELWDGTKIRNLGVRLSNFTTFKAKQYSLFEKEEKDDNIDKVIDSINDKLGKEFLTFASLTEKEED